MNYWQIEIKPDENWREERAVLEQSGVIGTHLTEEAKKQFQDEMAIGDIVLVRRGKKPVAIVEVTGELEDAGGEDLDRIDWFQFRRKVKILDWAKRGFVTIKPETQALGIVSESELLFQYIKVWHEDLSLEVKKDQYVIKELYIKNYKMFYDFNLKLTDEKENSLSVVVLAGENGTGKTTLLEYLAKYQANKTDYLKLRWVKRTKKLSLLQSLSENQQDEINYKRIEFQLTKNPYVKTSKEYTDLIKEYRRRVVYIPINLDLIENIEQEIARYIDHRLRFFDQRKSDVLDQLQRFIDDIFSGLEGINLQIANIDMENKIYFHNGNGDEFHIDQLSTGEKTLLAKVLYLYLKGFNNQIILIDEPEISLHPQWQNRVLQIYERFAEAFHNQIIIATHSPHIIGSARPEMIRVFQFDQNRRVRVLDRFSKSYGLEFQQILTDVMGVNELRVPEVEERMECIKKLIFSNQYQSDQHFQKEWNQLEEMIGADHPDLKLLKLEMNLRERKNVSDQ